VGFLGALMVSKAPHLLRDALDLLPEGSVAVSVYGTPVAYHGDTSYSARIAGRLAHPWLTLHGPLPHHMVATALSEMDVLVFPSVWEETSGIGAREALAAGVPVVASRIGGVPEFVDDGVNGLLFTPDDAHDLARHLRRLVSEPGLLARLRHGIRPVRTLQDDVAATRSHYRDVAARTARRRPAPRRIAAVVLNFQTPEQTALAAGWLSMSDFPLDAVVVVDNGDGVACGAALTPASNGRLIATGSNLGFAGGCNVGIRDALARGADAVLLVNSDVIVPPDGLARLVAALDEPGVGIVGPVVRSRSRPDRVLSAGIDFDHRTGRMRNRASIADRSVLAMPAVSGCAMLVDRQVFDAIGGLPEAYFFGAARAAGFGVRVVSSAAVYHQGSGTMGGNPDRLYYAVRNHLHLAAATPSRSRVHSRLRACAIAGYNLVHAVRAPGSSLPARLAAVGLGVTDYARGRSGRR
jgi:GT2 family glycosyltransferase